QIVALHSAGFLAVGVPTALSPVNRGASIGGAGRDTEKVTTRRNTCPPLGQTGKKLQIPRSELQQNQVGRVYWRLRFGASEEPGAFLKLPASAATPAARHQRQTGPLRIRSLFPGNGCGPGRSWCSRRPLH